MAEGLSGFAIVAGAGSGIGLECACAYAAAGIDGLLAVDINKQSVEKATEEITKAASHPAFRVFANVVDVASEDAIEEMTKTAVQTFGRIDFAVNSAGIGAKHPAEFADTNLEEFDKFYNINARGAMLFARSISRVMREQSPRSVQGRHGPRDLGRGVIINIASLNSYLPIPGITSYVAAKHAMLGITRNAALDNAKHNIRVNAICPSWVQTPLIDAYFEAAPEIQDSIKRAVALGRIASPEEIADLAIFLSGKGGSYITGQGLVVDGGTSLQVRYD